MKKYLLVLFIAVFIIPSIAFASWWNPFSWNWGNFFNSPKQNQTQNFTTTVPTTPDITTSSTKTPTTPKVNNTSTVQKQDNPVVNRQEIVNQKETGINKITQEASSTPEAQQITSLEQQLGDIVTKLKLLNEASATASGVGYAGGGASQDLIDRLSQNGFQDLALSLGDSRQPGTTGNLQGLMAGFNAKINVDWDKTKNLGLDLAQQQKDLQNKLQIGITSNTRTFETNLCDLNPKITNDNDRTFCHSLFK